MNRGILILATVILIGEGLALGAEPGKRDSLKVDIIGHRGASWDAPENTVSSIRLAWEQGADSVEFDIYLTKDGVIVVCHDEDTKRTSGVKKLIAESSFVDLRTLDVGKWKDPKFAGEKIPTLQEMLETIPTGKKVYIEVKCGIEIIPELVKTLKRSQLKPAQTPVISFNADLIAAVKQADPAIHTYWIQNLKKEPTAESLIAKAKEIHADGLDLGARPILDREYAAKIRAAGLRLDVWTVNEPDFAKRMIEIGVDGIETDRPGWLREQLAE